MPEWVYTWTVYLTVFIGLYLYQRTRWGIRIMTIETMRKEMEREIGDVLWGRVADGKMSWKECNKLCNFLADVFDFPDLRSYRRGKYKLKADILRRIRNLKRSPKPKIPGDKPLQVIEKPITKQSATVTHIKFNAA